MTLRKAVALVLVVSTLLILMATPAMAAKPENNLAGAITVPWNLSADVMPVPPYGSKDISGSDTASKLQVNQPNGQVEAAITGVMKGLDPNSEYTVYLSNGYQPYVYTGWDITGNWVIRFVYYGGNYDHNITIDVQNDGTFSGFGSAGSHTETLTGTIDVMSGDIWFRSTYENNYWYEATGTISADGTMSGTWGNDSQGYGHTWSSTSGVAVETHTGNTGWSGLFTNTIQPFKFMTDEDGSGSWHFNMKDANFPGPGSYTLSVWVNAPGATILISDNFHVEVD